MKAKKILLGVGAIGLVYLIYKYSKCPKEINCVHRNPMAKYDSEHPAPPEPHPYCNNMPFICKFKTKALI